MDSSDQRTDDLAGAILDGEAIDWTALESTSDPAQWELLSRLKVLATVAGFHRRAPWLPSDEVGSWRPAGPLDVAAANQGLETWGHLRLLERIGVGGFGEVYRAWDSRLDREVALKLLPAARCRMSGSQSLVIHEGRLLARVRHTNVVTIHGAEQIGDTVGLWMEFVRGKTLAELLDEGQTFTTAEATEICLELCGALSAVHEAGLLHGDIKAHNVMRAADGRILLMDFGAGRELDDFSSPSGTPVYLAPEVFSGAPATIRSDIYSLGVLLFHLVTGAYPVAGRTVSELRSAHERGKRLRLSTMRADLHPSLIRVIDRATDPDPERRYPTADALAADLRVQNEHAVAADMRVLRRRPGIGAMVLAVSACVLLVVAVGVRMAMLQQQSPASAVALPEHSPQVAQQVPLPSVDAPMPPVKPEMPSVKPPTSVPATSQKASEAEHDLRARALKASEDLRAAEDARQATGVKTQSANLPAAKPAARRGGQASGDYREAFSKAIIAINRGSWKEARILLEHAIGQNSAESLERIAIGDFGNAELYLPKFFLGIVLKNLGDCAGALGVWAESEKAGVVQRTKHYPILQKEREGCRNS